jgi:hypothetical protein|tara:strand:+ start:208 stop:342 length:135 start_codon:yes stop_codon:yes gene_type:complete
MKRLTNPSAHTVVGMAGFSLDGTGTILPDIPDQFYRVVLTTNEF